ncbi:hypothetical protein Tco_1417681 [Tanacetum coccineum]
MIEPEVRLKRKDQVSLDEDLARNIQAQLDAEIIEEERLERTQERNEKKVEEVEADDKVELKKHLVIKKDDDIEIDDIPLATKPPMIAEYKLLKEEDWRDLWKLVKTKHADTRPEDEYERVLLGDFKVMFEPDIRSKLFGS